MAVIAGTLEHRLDIRGRLKLGCHRGIVPGDGNELDTEQDDNDDQKYLAHTNRVSGVKVIPAADSRNIDTIADLARAVKLFRLFSLP
jgi:hypothetical protein